jgi:hypothetical protein
MPAIRGSCLWGGVKFEIIDDLPQYERYAPAT